MKDISKDQLRVLIGACMFNCGMMGTFMTCWSTLVAVIKVQYAMPMTRISLFSSIGGITGIIGGATLGTLFFRSKKKKAILFGCVALTCASFLLVAFGPDKINWFIAPVLMTSASCTYGQATPYILQSWFKGKAGSAQGIAMSTTSIAGVILNPITSRLVESIGLQKTIFILTGITLMLAIPGLMLEFAKPIPEFRTSGGSSAANEADAVKKAQGQGLVFGLVCLLLVCTTLTSQLPGYMTMFAQTRGFSLTTGATITSVMLAAAIFYKIAFGSFADSIGIWKAVRISFCVVTAAAASLLLLAYNVPVFCISVVFYAMCYGANAIVMARACVAAYGENYTKYLPLHTSINSAFSAVLSYCIGLLYEKTQGFSALIVIIICAGFAGFAILTILNRMRPIAIEKK